MKALILYYSFEGNTEFIASELAKHFDSQLQKVEPLKELKSKGFSKYIWGGRQAVMKQKPPIKAINQDLDQYDLILIGCPVWAFTYAPPIRTFLEENSLSGKKVGFFYCSEGSPGKTLEHFKEAVKGSDFVGAQGFVNPLKGNMEKMKADVVAFANLIKK